MNKTQHPRGKFEVYVYLDLGIHAIVVVTNFPPAALHVVPSTFRTFFGTKNLNQDERKEGAASQILEHLTNPKQLSYLLCVPSQSGESSYKYS